MILTGADGDFIIGVDWSSFGDVADPERQGAQPCAGVGCAVPEGPEVTRRNTRVYFVQPLKERIVREVGYGLSLEGAPSVDLVKSRQPKSEPVAHKSEDCLNSLKWDLPGADRLSSTWTEGLVIKAKQLRDGNRQLWSKPLSLIDRDRPNPDLPKEMFHDGRR